MTSYPEHEKQAKVIDQAQAISEFLEWLAGQGVQLMTWREDLTDTRPDDDCPAAKYSRLHCDHWGHVNAEHECCNCGRPYGFREITGIKGWVREPRGILQLLADWAGIDLNVIGREAPDARRHPRDERCEG